MSAGEAICKWLAPLLTPLLSSVIYAAHALGVVGFASLWGRLTEPGLFGGSWFWR